MGVADAEGSEADDSADDAGGGMGGEADDEVADEGFGGGEVVVGFEFVDGCEEVVEELGDAEEVFGAIVWDEDVL